MKHIETRYLSLAFSKLESWHAVLTARIYEQGQREVAVIHPKQYPDQELAVIMYHPRAMERKSLKGLVMVPGFSVYLPDWNDGDPSIGDPGGYEVFYDEFDDPDCIANNMAGAALEVASFFFRESLRGELAGLAEVLTDEFIREQGAKL